MAGERGERMKEFIKSAAGLHCALAVVLDHPDRIYPGNVMNRLNIPTKLGL